MEIASAIVIGSLISAATAAGTTAYNAYAAQQANDTSFSQSRDMAEWQAKELPKLKVQGLRDAGLNPILGYDSLGSASVPVFNAQAGSAGDFSQIGRILSKLPEVQSADALRKSEIEKNNNDILNQAQIVASNIANAGRQTDANVAEAQSRIALNNARTMETLGDTNSAKALDSMRNAIENFYKYSALPKWSMGFAKNTVEWHESADPQKWIRDLTEEASRFFNGTENSPSSVESAVDAGSNFFQELMQGRINGKSVSFPSPSTDSIKKNLGKRASEALSPIVPKSYRPAYELFKMLVPEFMRRNNFK